MSAPRACECRFCGENFTAAGIKNHEKYCDDNPEKGMDPDRAEELGLLDTETAGDDEAPDADPHQRDNSGGRLPSRQTLPEDDNSYTPDKEPENADEKGLKCPGCGSTDCITTDEALREFRDRLERVPPALEQTLENTENYCNECFSVSGGALSDPFDLTEGVA